MDQKICIPKNYFYLILIIFAMFTHIHYLNYEKKLNLISNNNYLKNKEIDNIKKSLNKIDKKASVIHQDNKSNTNNKSVSNYIQSDKDLFIERDRRVLVDDLVAPERRLPRHAYPTRYLKSLINIPTRGYPDNYQNMGILVRKEDEKVLKLFGRQVYPGSDQYEYYVVDNNNSADNKVPLNTPGKKELYDNDVVPIPWLDESKGLFEVKIFDYNVPRYNPYDY